MKKNKTTMKKLNIIWTIILIVFMISCEEEQVGQYPIDKIAPQKVSNPVVENFKGGATITYDLPEEKDLLYIKAVFTLPSGKEKEGKASAFANSITINGFSKSAKAQVQLISVDKSRNESDPVIVEVEPLDSPIFDVYANLNVIASFGGLKLTWENPDKEDIVIGVLNKNEENGYEQVETIYTSVASGNGSVRGLEARETEFGIYVRDIYDNYTDTLFLTLTPWEETMLDKSLWRAMTLCSTFTLSQYGSTNMAVLWDGVTTNISSSSTMYYINNTKNSDKIYFTFDLGVNAKLSRFKFWGRTSWYFNLHHPKEIEIWGTNDAMVANGDPCGWTGWELLTSCVSTKPSGDDVLSNANLTSEDLALAAAGEEFEFPLEVPITRFIRFRTVRTWTDSKSVFLGELTFWGSVVQ
jgi:hypothetical protein